MEYDTEAAALARSVVSTELIRARGGAEVGKVVAAQHGQNSAVVAAAGEKLEHYNHPELVHDADFDGVRTRLRSFLKQAAAMRVG